MLRRLMMGFALAGAIASGAAAQDLPKSQFKVIGLNGPTPVSIHDEVPFWRKTITEASKGAITADITDRAARSGHNLRKIAEKLKKRHPPRHRQPAAHPRARQVRIPAPNGFMACMPSRPPWPTPAASWAEPS